LLAFGVQTYEGLALCNEGFLYLQKRFTCQCGKLRSFKTLFGVKNTLYRLNFPSVYSVFKGEIDFSIENKFIERKFFL